MANYDKQSFKRQGPSHFAYTFLLGMVCVFLVPIINIAPEYSTFIHSFRPEMVMSVMVAGFAVWGLSNSRFREFLASIRKTERICIIFPLVLFVAWSAISAIWATSTASVLHHTSLWICYLSLYLFARYLLTQRGTEPMIYAILGFSLVIAVPVLIEYFTAILGGETPSVGARYSKYTELINTLTPLLIAFALRVKGKARFLTITCVFFIGLFAIASNSRTGTGIFALLVIALMTTVFAVRHYRSYRKNAIVLTFIVVMIPIVTYSVSAIGSSSVPIVDRFQTNEISESTNTRPLLTNIAIEMWSAGKLTGVGADNYGQVFNRYRLSYSKAHPNDPNLQISINESGIPERAHNEYSQILAELGLVGIAIFASFIVGIFYLGSNIFRKRFRVPFLTVAAFAGVGAFLASSVVTSYSFRLPQNGLAFFIVLAVAVSGSFSSASAFNGEPSRKSRKNIGSFLVVMILASVGLFVHSAVRLAAVTVVRLAEQQNSIESAEPLYLRAIAIDDSNGNILTSFGWNLVLNKRAEEGIPYLRRSIDVGRSTSPDYSYLATAQIVAGKPNDALATLEEGVGVYPYSVFLLTRQASLLKLLGRTDESVRQFEKAKSLNLKQAMSWWYYINEGGNAAAKHSFEDDLTPLMELLPKQGVYAIQGEREIRFPEEKFAIPPG